MLAALAPKVRDCREPLRAQHVGNALYGLRSCGDSPELREMLAAVAHRRYAALATAVRSTPGGAGVGQGGQRSRGQQRRLPEPGLAGARP